MSTDEDWKARYFEEATAWEATDKLLRRALSRVAIAAEGNSKKLDEALHRVQKHARAGADTELDRDIAEVSDIVRRMDLGAAPAGRERAEKKADNKPETGAAENPATAQGEQAPQASSQDFCAELLDALDVSAERARSLQNFRKHLGEVPPAECLGKLAVEISALLKEQRGLDGGVREVLLALIDEVALVQPGMGALKTIREAVQRGSDADWHTALSRIIGEIRTIIQRISADKEALEALLNEVNDELGDIAGVLVSEQAGLVSGRKESADFHEIMSQGVSRIQEHIETESDIERLKEGVSQSLGGIRTAITDFAESDAKRLEEAEQRNEELQARVARMEKESERLRKGLDRKREQLMHDTLTGVRSRLAYDETIAQELGRFRRYKEAFSIAVLDIDHFKAINDTYGHAAGDKALKLVAQKINDKVRETDLLFRVGGEEFVLLLPKTGFSAGKLLVEDVRQVVGHAPFHFEGKPVHITMSAGVTVVREEDTAETIFARADDAMYRAKKAGRDRLIGLE